MKIHTTNYINTFITVSDDCPIGNGTVPPLKGDALTIANRQFDMIVKIPTNTLPMKCCSGFLLIRMT